MFFSIEDVFKILESEPYYVIRTEKNHKPQVAYPESLGDLYNTLTFFVKYIYGSVTVIIILISLRIFW